jgi:hypothetical protein
MIEMLIEARKGDLGNGLKVLRVLPYAKRRMVGPFIFLDHAGPLSIAAQDIARADVRPHPHIGLATVSYLLSGMIVHRDSLGVTQEIRPGDVNWMTAGRGISHSERFRHPDSFADGGLELLQAWVALPAEHEEAEPAFDHYPADSLPLIETAGARMRLIAGRAFGCSSPVRTLSPLFYLHAELKGGGAPDGAGRIPRTRALRGRRAGDRGRPHAGARPDGGAGARCHPRRTGARGRHAVAAGRRAGRAAPHLVEFRRQQQGAHRTGQGRLAERPHPAAAARLRRVHSPAAVSGASTPMRHAGNRLSAWGECGRPRVLVW